jgi:hypothetical protein
MRSNGRSRSCCLSGRGQCFSRDARQTTCDPTTITTVDGKYTPKTDGVSTQDVTCQTICPDGRPGPCATPARWQFRSTGPRVCCARKDGDPPCPPGKRAEIPCASDWIATAERAATGPVPMTPARSRVASTSIAAHMPVPKSPDRADGPAFERRRNRFLGQGSVGAVEAPSMTWPTDS